MSAPAAGVPLVRLLARIVPARERARWRDEWEAELDWASAHPPDGLPPALARLALLVRALGALPDALEMRRSYGGDPVLAHDLRFALRALVRRPGYAALVALTLALGIGASTAVFTVVDAVLLRPLPFRDAARLVELEVQHPEYTVPYLEPGMVDGWQAQVGLFDDLARHRAAPGGAVLEEGEPRALRVEEVSDRFFPLLGVAPRLGRTLAPDEVARGDRVVMVSEPFWRSTLAADPAAVGRTIRVSGEDWTVVGVMPAHFRYPRGEVALWRPLPAEPPPAPGARPGRVHAVARLAPGLAPPAAQARVNGLVPGLRAQRPDVREWALRLTPVGEWRANPDVRRSLLLLAGAVGLVLLIACANAANLLLVRATSGRRDLTVRLALGATRWRIARDLLTEAALLALAGGALGVLLAVWGVRAILALAPAEVIAWSYGPIAIDARVLGFAVALSVLTVLLFGVLPAVQATRRRAALVGGTRAETGTRDQRRLRGLLVTGQLALSLTLLAGAGLLVHSFARLASVPPGMDVEQLALLTLSPSSDRYPTRAERVPFYEEVVARLRAIPGVRAVSVVSGIAGGHASFMFGTALEAEHAGRPAGGDPELLPFGEADTGYFHTLGIPIVQGRAFDASDLVPDANTAVVDGELARHLWPDGRAVGRRFRTGAESPWLTVVGVAGDVKLMGPDDRQHRFELYRPVPFGAGGHRTIAVRTAGDPEAILSLLKATVHAVDPLQPVSSVTTAAEAYREPLAKPRFLLVLMAVFAGVAALLSAVGLYGVIAYAVTQRTREIGVRMALGARRERIVGDVVREGATLAAVGIAAGLGAALALGRFLESLLFGVSPADPLTLGGVALAFALVALLATYLPARRASRIDPVVAMRAE